MALVQKTSPVGIDLAIKKLQELLFNNLTWSSATNGYESYERAYKNESKDGLLPEVFISNGEYREVFTNDSFSATSFFLVSDSRTIADKITTEVDIVFQLNLKELYPLISHRADEEAHKQVYDILWPNPYRYALTSLVTGISNVYSGLNIGQVNFDDMQKFHVFKVTMNVIDEMGC